MCSSSVKLQGATYLKIDKNHVALYTITAISFQRNDSSTLFLFNEFPTFILLQCSYEQPTCQKLLSL